MTWLDRAVALLGTREWLMLMVIAIVVAAFMRPDFRIDDERKDEKNDRGGKEERD